MGATIKDRRTSPRLEVDATFTGGVVDARQLTTGVRDLALNGFSVESASPCVVGTRHTFRFVTDGGLAVRLRVEAVYSRRDDAKAGGFVNGFKFLADTPEAAAAIDLLVDTATAPLTFD